MAFLAIEGSGGCHHDDDAALGVGADGRDFCEVLEGLADEVDGAAEVDVEDEVEVVQAECRAMSVKDLFNKSASMPCPQERKELRLPVSRLQRLG